jgi:hypothetical protein
VKTSVTAALSFTFLINLPSCGQVATNSPTNTEARRIKNVAPEEMWKRVTECTFPVYPPFALQTHITDTVDIALLVIIMWLSERAPPGSHNVFLFTKL